LYKGFLMAHEASRIAGMAVDAVITMAAAIVGSFR
jgi:hypothetical protein